MSDDEERCFIMEIRNLIDEAVVHKAFGKGIIKSIDGKYLEVKFLNGNKESRFVYPSCFNGFLTLEDERKHAETEKDLELWKTESGIVQKEELRNRHEKTTEAIEARKTAAEEKKLQAARRTMEHRIEYINARQEKNPKQ